MASDLRFKLKEYGQVLATPTLATYLLSMSRPLIGITTDYIESPRPASQCAMAYANAVREAGGTPVLLPPIPELAAEHASICRGFVFTGGGDVRMERFGEPTHKEAKPVHPLRQEYELALLDALKPRSTPVLGICLGMQFMSLHAGAKFNQHLPDTHTTSDIHRGNDHKIIVQLSDWTRKTLPTLLNGSSNSNHHQAVATAGSLQVLALSPDGVIEAVADPLRPFYVGVQWHPERTADRNLGIGIFQSLIAAVRGST